jgi:hypothetical protein
MSKEKKEKTLLQRVLDREKVEFAQYSMHEIEKLVYDLVELQLDKIRAEEVIKLLDVIGVASAKIREVVSKEK